MSTMHITFDTFTNQDELQLTVTMNDQTVWHSMVGTDRHTVRIAIDDDLEGQHVLGLCLSGKTPEHTKLDAQGEIVSDRLLYIEHMAVDDIKLGQTFFDIARYCHDHNGTQALIDDSFFGAMGCNGTVTMKFSTPSYLWLLEVL